MPAQHLWSTSLAEYKTYLIHCRRCGLQYVGETGQPLHNWMNSHYFNIAYGCIIESPVSAHLINEGHTKTDPLVKIHVIDRCWKDAIFRNWGGSTAFQVVQWLYYAQTVDLDNTWIALRKPRINALRNNRWIVCTNCGSMLCATIHGLSVQATNTESGVTY